MTQKTFNFGKIDYNNSGRKNCLVTVEVELKESENGPVFTASGNIWNSRKTDCYSCGQNLDTIAEYINTPLFGEILRLWNAYHLNDMNRGTIAQDEALKECQYKNGYNYTEACEYLKSVDMYNDEGYLYGHSWLYREIPLEDLNKIRAILA